MNQPINQRQGVAPQHPKNSLWLYILIVILLLVSGFFGWSYFSNNTAQGGTTTTGSPSLAQTNSPTPTIDCEKYISQNYGFSINYPKTYTYEEKTSAGSLGEIIFSNKSLGDSYNVTIAIANKTASIEPPNGLKPASTKDVTIADFAGKNFDDVAYVFDNDKYRFSVTVDGGADQTLKIMAKFIANSFQFNG